MSNVPNQVNIHEDTPNQVIVNQDAPNQVVVRFAGAGSSNTRRHVHSQESASTTWTINHTLGGKPQVTIVDSANTVVIGTVTYNSNSQVTVDFTAPFSGYAYLT
jgi:hypothetical protein